MRLYKFTAKLQKEYIYYSEHHVDSEKHGMQTNQHYILNRLPETVEIHCFLCRQLQNTVCNIKTYVAQFTQILGHFSALKMSLRDKLCYIVFGSGMGNTL